MLLTVLIFVLVLSVLVIAHESGHFLTAVHFGVKAEEFGLGFPPRAIGWYRNRRGKWKKLIGRQSRESLEKSANEDLIPGEKNTIYSLNYLPLGGFVKIKGENGEGKNDQNSFASKSIGKRAIILSAGVAMNIILAWLLFSVGYLIGLPQSTTSLGANARVTQAHVIVAEALPNSPAAQAGLKIGDIILKLDKTNISTEKSLQEAVGANDNQEINLLIKRQGQEQNLKLTPHSENGQRATIGVSIFSSGLVTYPFFSALWQGAKTDVWVLKGIFVSLWNLLLELFQGQNIGGQFAGPIGIANITGQAARLGFSYLIQFAALLSLNLAVINILPFPALDGGRILFLIIEKIKGKPVRREVENIIHNIGFLLLMLLVLLVTYKDIVKLF